MVRDLRKTQNPPHNTSFSVPEKTPVCEEFGSRVLQYLVPGINVPSLSFESEVVHLQAGRYRAAL